MNLEMDKKQSMNESGNLAYQLEQAKGGSDGENNFLTDIFMGIYIFSCSNFILFPGMRMSIRAESEESAQNKILRLEKENRRLQSVLNSYNVSMSSSQIAEVIYLFLFSSANFAPVLST